VVQGAGHHVRGVGLLEFLALLVIIVGHVQPKKQGHWQKSKGIGRGSKGLRAIERIRGRERYKKELATQSA
jgi:hypothetical protein